MRICSFVFGFIFVVDATLEEMMDDLQLRFMDARDKDNGKN